MVILFMSADSASKRYVAYVMYPPVTNKKVMEGDIEKMDIMVTKLGGSMEDKDFCSANLPEQIDKKDSCEMSMFYFTLPNNNNLKENLKELLRIITPKYNSSVMRMKYIHVDHKENYLHTVKEYFHKA